MLDGFPDLVLLKRPPIRNLFVELDARGLLVEGNDPGGTGATDVGRKATATEHNQALGWPHSSHAEERDGSQGEKKDTFELHGSCRCLTGLGLLHHP